MIEPEWDENTRQWALALAYNHASLCNCGCGFPAAVSQAPENEDRFFVDDPIRCHARTAIERKQSRVNETEPPAPEALLFSVELRDGVNLRG